MTFSSFKPSSKICAAATAAACAFLLTCTLALAQEPAPQEPVPQEPAPKEPGAKYRLSVDAPTKELREMLSKGLQLARWIEDPQMTPELLRRLADEAVGEAREALAAQGYYSAMVSYSIDRDATPWSVVIHVVPGTQTKVSAVNITFSGPGAEDPDPEAVKLRRQVQREWLLRPGTPFTQEAWNDAKRDAVRRFSSWRYAGARLASSRARVDPEAHSAALEVELDSGPPYVFGGVEVRGGKRYPDKLAAYLSPVRPGTPYDRQVLERYTRRLLETGYYASARSELALDARDDAGSPVRTSVIEGNSQNFEGGVSYNTDAGPRLELSHRNVDLFNTAWRGKAQLRLDQLTQEARYDLDSPPRPGATWWSASVGAKRSIVQNEDTEEVALGGAYNWAGRGVPSQVLVSAHAEEQRVQGQPNDHRHAVFFGLRFGFRDTDEIVLPRRGYFGQVTVGGAPEALATQAFSRVTARATMLVPLGRNDDLQIRGEGGLVVAASREGIPSTFLFRTGGDQTLRGYDFESLGVRRNDAILGGRYLAVGSVEYTHWFAPVWGLAAFADSGNAWDTGDFEPVLGVGFGARFRTPIGPVRVDLAYGVEEESWRLHFSVGFVF